MDSINGGLHGHLREPVMQRKVVRGPKLHFCTRAYEPLVMPLILYLYSATLFTIAEIYDQYLAGGGREFEFLIDLEG